MLAADLLPEEAYAVGNAAIDDEHRRLVERIAALLSATSDEDAERAAEQLVEVWRSHCVEEEELMEAAAYPDTARHKEIHVELDGLLMYFLETNIGKIKDGHREVAQFLFDWFCGHVKACDAPLADYLDQRAAHQG